MLLVELGQAVWVHVTHATDALAVAAQKLAPPTPPTHPEDGIAVHGSSPGPLPSS